MKSILFVCTGNTCRSPLAEGIFTKMIASKDSFSISSAGLHARDGLPASEKTVAILAKQGIDFSKFRSQSLRAEKVQEATHIFVMTKSHLQEILTLYPNIREKTFLLSEGTTREDIDDPIGGTLDAYEQCAHAIEEALERILLFIEKNLI